MTEQEYEDSEENFHLPPLPKGVPTSCQSEEEEWLTKEFERRARRDAKKKGASE